MQDAQLDNNNRRPKQGARKTNHGPEATRGQLDNRNTEQRQTEGQVQAGEEQPSTNRKDTEETEEETEETARTLICWMRVTGSCSRARLAASCCCAVAELSSTGAVYWARTGARVSG